jgi:hypothetical protein
VNPSDRDPFPRRTDRVVRRGLLAGAVTGVVVGAALGVGLSGAGGAASAAGVFAGLAIASFVATSWLVLALAGDVLAGDRPPTRRLLWTGGMVAVTGSTVLLALAVGQAAAA